MTTTGHSLDEAVSAALPEAGRVRLAELIEQVCREPAAVHRLFPAAARLVGRGPLDPADPTGIVGPTLDDAVRGILLEALATARAGEPGALLEDVEALYRNGDADEKRAALRALPCLGLGQAALPLLHDALRTNDTRLVGAAMGDAGTVQLDAATWRQGVLKCLFVGVPLSAVYGLRSRADAELARMVAAYAIERLAAGRDVPADALRVLADFPDVVSASGLDGCLPEPAPR
ncbi:EboA domain-containing protein [Georgenia yuyongxinii]|uniref:EboA domain-containing protein n=1 Tax=Georgenia yuyongxinii TaxID=2589797 RepID=UPI0015D2F0B2|nr:EboA domain-containing protein [Georgenia yuyongxinii]